MKIVTIEPTPSPNSMKLTLDESLNPGVRMSYTRDNRDQAPGHIRKLLDIPGVTGVYHTADFIALDRHPKGDWQAILAAAREVMGVAEGGTAAGSAARGSLGAGAAGGRTGEGTVVGAGAGSSGGEGGAGFGEVSVMVQMFRGIPMQVRVLAGTEQSRAALPDRFQQAAMKAGLASANLIMERKLVDRGIRYGELDEVLQDVMKELEASYDDGRLQELVAEAFSGEEAGGGAGAEAGAGSDAAGAEAETKTAATEALLDADWRKRYAALERLTPGPDTLELLVQALGDAQVSVRRLAVVYLGDVREPEDAALPHLLRALKDPSPIIRRTAGDTLSDRGDPAAGPAMAEALGDSSKLVRWRAARFLYEVGDESALPALKAAQEDPEFEVRLQIRLAMERIEGGEAAQGTVWQQMTRARREDGEA